ncbi:SWIM zinc finger family protein [Actinomadura sp. HBU206391]|uniref:SWIM zinc finger family protein n=1 Tax=Actinomadura sp. HBU206391 TaxID=2731692 RepID=UPI002905A288|nr:SWIM zinc finger family protein [Actinomadura sp. HBU206391]
MTERWGREQVLGLAPDAPSGKAAATAARPAKWSGTGCDEQAVWGSCQGSGKSAYRAIVDLSEPAFRCSCPSRKFPCKHALALLLLWSDGTVPEQSPPGWVTEWLAERRDRADQAERRRAGKDAAEGKPGGARDPKTAERREQRAADGVADLDQWLRDQVAHGLAHAERAPYQVWDDAARRLVDAQAGALAGQVRALASVPRRGADWPQRLLEEYALLRLLTTAFDRRAELPEPLNATVRSRVGFTLNQEEVLAGERVRDLWYVAGSSDTEQDRLITRRVWLRGRETGRSALVLSFGAPGRALDASLVVGATIDAVLAFYPGAQPLRALVAERHASPRQYAPRGTTVQGLLREHADALSRDPWLDRWPAVLADLRLGRRAGDDGWHVVDPAGDALPLRTTDPWRLLAVSGGRPLTVAGEWSPRGLVPLSAWQDEEGLVIL